MEMIHCPVCGMDTPSHEITTEHNGICYHFCSQQCLENFSKHPALYLSIKSPKREGKSVIKRRSFVLDTPVPDAGTKSFESVISEMMGVREVVISGEKVSVTYDLLEVTAEQIEQVLEKAGAKLGTGWASRLKRGWVQYKEENEIGILASTDAACCNKPPKQG